MEVIYCAEISEGPFKGRLITEDGQILAEKGKEISFLSQKERSSGLLTVQITAEGKKCREYVHILVAMMFKGEDKGENEFILHLDGNNKNNHKDNLMWSKDPFLNSKFKRIQGFSNYAVSKDGKLISLFYNRPKLLSPYYSEGYSMFSIRNDDGKAKNMRLHRLIAMTYLPNPDNLPEVDHIDRQRDNNKLENLRWANRELQSTNRVPKKSKRVLCFAKNGVFIKEYKSAKDAVLLLKLTISESSIRESARKNKTKLIKSVGGYYWKFVQDDKSIYILQKGEISHPIVGNFKDYVLNYPNYQITNFGNVLDDKHCLMSRLKAVYPSVGLWKNNKSRLFKIHILVALFFVKGRTDKNNEVDHLDEDKLNTKFDNLEWVTHQENSLRCSHKKFKSVKKISSKTGKVLKIYRSIKEAATDNGATTSGISACCRGSQETAHGFKWEYA